MLLSDISISVNDLIDQDMDVEEKVSLLRAYLDTLPEKAFNLGTRVVFALICIFIGYWIIKIIRHIVKKSMIRAKAEVGAIQFADSVLKAILYVLLVFFIARNFGIDAASIVALLGSMGVAIGLALQGSLQNFVGGFLLMLLKPYKVGDYIKEGVGGNEGTVTKISTFYTTLLTLDGKVVVIPNATLSNTSLINFSAAGFRRVEGVVSIAYHEDIDKARDVLKKACMKDDRILKDREVIVFVDELADSSVVLKVYAFTNSADYMAAKWDINERLKKALDEAGILIPFPQLDIHTK